MQALSAIEIPPASRRPAQHVVIAMHGYGADASQFVPVLERWARDLPDAAMYAVHGPAACQLQPAGREWFALTNLPSALHARARATAPLVEAFIDQALARHGLGPERLALAGFSPGAVMALYLGPRRRPALGAIVSFAGVLTGAGELAAQGERPRTLLVQGTVDRMVRLSAMQAAHAELAARGASVECQIRAGGDHAIDDASIEGASRFLRRALVG
ncbi:MAG TPA: dienelactone hydrolase family protein [Kofleriaceae bacterium]|nr:dienelactone hydrolase family protein [Kofleriaceae bacterium]